VLGEQPLLRVGRYVARVWGPGGSAVAVSSSPNEGVRVRHRMSGVRLGKWDRWLLLNAPANEAPRGLWLDDGDRSVKEGRGRSARRLATLGLIDLERARLTVDARYRPGEVLRFDRRGFWRREDSARGQVVRRNVVWLTAFGRQIRLRYALELENGLAIRWDPREVEEAVRGAQGHFRDPFVRYAYLEERERETRDAARARSLDRRRIEVLSDMVDSVRARERWSTAVAIVHARAEYRNADDAMEQAADLFSSSDAALLAANNARQADPKLSSSELYRRAPRSLLRP